MERYRIAYYNKDGEASEAVVEAENDNADAAIAKLDDFGHGASVTSLGTADSEPVEERPDDEDVNEGDEEPLSGEDIEREESRPPAERAPEE